MRSNSKKIIFAVFGIIIFAGLGWLIFHKKNNPAAPRIESIALLLINQQTLRPGANNIGDIVGIYEGDHQFSPSETGGFDIVKVNNISKEKAQAYLNTLLPADYGKISLPELNKNSTSTPGLPPASPGTSLGGPTSIYNSPKYLFRVIDKNQTDFEKMVGTNVVKK